jgi:hypothetical protein
VRVFRDSLQICADIRRDVCQFRENDTQLLGSMCKKFANFCEDNMRL